MSPSEFWRLPPGQVWWIIDARTPPEQKARAEGMGRVYKMLKEAQAEEAGHD